MTGVDIAGLVRLDGAPPDAVHVRAMLGRADAGIWTRATTSAGTWAWSAEPDRVRAPEDPPPLVMGPGLTLVADARVDGGFPAATGSDEPGDDGPRRLARAVARWGAAAVDHLVGDFAFAALVGDRLILGRDEMSMRPLYFSRTRDGTIRFGSTSAVLRNALGRPGPVDAAAVAAFLTGAPLDPGRSFFLDVNRVPPGAAVVISRDGEMDVVRGAPGARESGPFADADEGLRELWIRLQTAVRDRLPAGASALMLSGGADSAAVCLALAALGPESRDRCTALTWTFRELETADESWAARRVAELAGVRLETVPGDDLWPLKDRERSVPDEDSPFVWPFRALDDRTFRAARERGADVLLTGDRGDYVMGDWVYGDGRTLDYPAVPDYLAPALSEEARHLRTAAGPMVDHPDGRLRRQRILDWGGAQIAEMNARAFRRAGLVYADPWSDRRITDLVAALPPSWVNRPREPKHLLRRLLSRLGLPTSDPSSGTQTALFERGIREREAPVVRALWRDPVAGELGFVAPVVLRRAVDRYVSGGDLPFDLWKPISLELWLRRLHGVPLP